MSDVAENELDQVLAYGERLVASGKLVDALRHFTLMLERFGPEEALLAAASGAWVTAVDSQDGLCDWPEEEADVLYELLILQNGNAVSPPVFHHRIAAQHSGGVVGHLDRAAAVLERVLERLLEGPEVHKNVVLMALLLRGKLRKLDQKRLSELHHSHFAGFTEGDLSIPYSVAFDRTNFRRNVADLASYVQGRSDVITDGSIPLHHLLLLVWLVPHEFDRLDPDWSAAAVRARCTRGMVDGREAEAARSLALRFDGQAHRALTSTSCYDVGPDFTRSMDFLSSERQVLNDTVQSGASLSVDKLEQAPRQALSAAWNFASARFPGLAKLRRKPKVAICVSGQLRGFRRTWKSWRPLLANVDATIFVNSWRRIGRGTPEPFRSALPFEGEAFKREYKAVGTELGLEELRHRYPTLFTAFDESGLVSEEELRKLYGTSYVHLDDENAPEFSAFSNSEKMYFKIEQCFRMAEGSGEDFDFIIRIRPDKPIIAVAFGWADLLSASRGRPVIFSETPLAAHYGTPTMGDQFALGLPEPSRIYAETWSRARELSELNLYRLHGELTGHSSLAYVCWLHGIGVHKVPIKFGNFQDAEPLSATAIRTALALDSIDRTDYIDRRLTDANRIDLDNVAVNV